MGSSSGSSLSHNSAYFGAIFRGATDKSCRLPSSLILLTTLSLWVSDYFEISCWPTTFKAHVTDFFEVSGFLLLPSRKFADYFQDSGY